MNTRFIKTTDNNIMIKMRKHIILNRVENIENPETGEIESVTMQTFNPTDEMLFADGWELYITPELTPEQILVNAREDKKRDIEEYDKSNDINEFYIQDIPVWLDKVTRAGLKLRFEAEIAIGKTETTLWYGNMQFPLELNLAMQMLYAIEVYASACYDNTQLHLANVDAIDTLDELLEYNYRIGYPEKLRF
jgi:hypothetical protein